MEPPLGAGAAPARRHRAVVGRRRRRSGWRGDLLSVVVDVEGWGPLLLVDVVVEVVVATKMVVEYWAFTEVVKFVPATLTTLHSVLEALVGFQKNWDGF